MIFILCPQFVMSQARDITPHTCPPTAHSSGLTEHKPGKSDEICESQGRADAPYVMQHRERDRDKAPALLISLTENTIGSACLLYPLPSDCHCLIPGFHDSKRCSWIRHRITHRMLKVWRFAESWQLLQIKDMHLLCKE